MPSLVNNHRLGTLFHLNPLAKVGDTYVDTVGGYQGLLPALIVPDHGPHFQERDQNSPKPGNPCDPV